MRQPRAKKFVGIRTKDLKGLDPDFQTKTNSTAQGTLARPLSVP